MALGVATNSANYLTSFHRFFGPDPMSNMASFKRSPELVSLAEKSLTLKNENDQRKYANPLQSSDPPLGVGGSPLPGLDAPSFISHGHLHPAEDPDGHRHRGRVDGEA